MPIRFKSSRLVSIRLLFAEYDFSLADELVVQPEAVFVCGPFTSGARRAAEQAHSGRCLKNIRRKRAPVHIEFNAQIARVGNPRHLVTFINDDHLWNESNEYGALSHFSLWPCF